MVLCSDAIIRVNVAGGWCVFLSGKRFNFRDMLVVMAVLVNSMQKKKKKECCMNVIMNNEKYVIFCS